MKNHFYSLFLRYDSPTVVYERIPNLSPVIFTEGVPFVILLTPNFIIGDPFWVYLLPEFLVPDHCF